MVKILSCNQASINIFVKNATTYLYFWEKLKQKNEDWFNKYNPSAVTVYKKTPGHPKNHSPFPQNLPPKALFNIHQMAPNLWASAGPLTNRWARNKDDEEDFFDAMCANNIRTIIALGNVAGPDGCHRAADFNDYMGAHHTPRVTSSGKYNVNSICQRGEETFYWNSRDRVVNETTIHKLTLNNDSQEHQLLVINIPTPDGRPIQFTDTQAPPTPFGPPATMTEYYDWYKGFASGENTNVHCASGVGRTGQIVLTFLITAMFDQMFVDGEDDLESRDNIHYLIEFLRSKRCVFVHGETQAQQAIKDAIRLKQFEAKLQHDKRAEPWPHLGTYWDEFSRFKQKYIAGDEDFAGSSHDKFSKRILAADVNDTSSGARELGAGASTISEGPLQAPASCCAKYCGWCPDVEPPAMSQLKETLVTQPPWKKNNMQS